MVCTAVLGTALNDTSVPHPYAIFIDGLDVVKEPGQARYGVKRSTIRITEAAPGDVSSMTFEIDDPQGLVGIANNARVQAWNYATDLPEFLGFVQSASSEPAFGDRGRYWRVKCYGIEAVLDTIIVPSMITGLSSSILSEDDVIQSAAVGSGLRAAIVTSGTRSTIAGPLGFFQSAPDNVTVDCSGLSIRSAYERYYVANYGGDPYITGFAQPDLTVDLWGGIRKQSPSFGNLGINFSPLDYTTLAITETPPNAGASLRWSFDNSPGSTITEVYVKGATALGTGWVAGDTTQGRFQAYVSSSTAVDEYTMRQAANTLLGTRGSGAGQGQITLESFTPTNTHPGTRITITNTGLGWSAKPFAISQIEKFNYNADGTQDWRLTFFELASKSARGGRGSTTIRRLTRGTLQ